MVLGQFCGSSRKREGTRPTGQEEEEAFRRRAPERVHDLLGRIATLTEPDFGSEEEAMYPALGEIFGRRYLEKLFADHDGAVRSAERRVELVGEEAWTDADVEEGVDLVRGILPHGSDCDGLSIMVERLPEDRVGAIEPCS